MQHGQTIDSNQRFISTIRCMEVRWPVVIKIHVYDDSVEPTEFRHFQPEVGCPGITSTTDLPVSCM